MTQNPVPSASLEPVTTSPSTVPSADWAEGRGEVIAGSLPDLARLTLADRSVITGSTPEGPAPPLPDSIAGAARIHITVNAYQGSSVTINAPTMDGRHDGTQVHPAGGHLTFVNPGRRSVALAATPALAAAVTNAPVGGEAPTSLASGIQPQPQAQNAAEATPVAPVSPATPQVPTAPPAGAAANVDVPASNATDPDEDIYPPNPSYMGKWYAIIVGRRVGVYPGWLICGGYVTGVSGNLHKSFPTCAEAYLYYVNKKIDGEVYVVPL